MGRRARLLTVVSLAIFSLVTAQSAGAVGGITITHAGITQGHLNATWTGPYSASAPAVIVLADDPFIEIATRPDVGTDGYFFTENVLTNDLIPSGQRQWLDSDQLSPPKQAGLYQLYARVHAWDSWATWDDYFGEYDGGVVWSAVTPFTLTAVGNRVVTRRGHYVYRWVHGKRRRVWVKPTYKTVVQWADS
jgi:hypothetical protein